MTASVAPISGRPCGEWNNGQFCNAPVVYDCPICRHRCCLAHSMLVKPPSKRKCCHREITEGEVQAWKRGDAAYARALVIQQHVVERRRLIGFILRDAYEITEDDVEHAMKAVGVWASVGEMYLGLAKLDAAHEQHHMDNISHCASNAVLCAEWARDWAKARSIDTNHVRAKGGLILLPPVSDEGEF